ncbi:MAG: peptidoglycan editing factor PgeF [Sphingomonadaceae bacterium]
MPASPHSPWRVPDWPGLPPGVGVLTTTRQAGVSPAPYDDGQGGMGFNLGVHVGDAPQHVQQNRARLRAVLPSEPYWLTQVHGTAVLEALGGAAAASAAGEVAPQADAAFARHPGAVCTIMAADCLPVLLCDTAGKVVGAAHAGWRGLAAGVLARTLDAMRAAGAGDIMAWLGPAIGPQQFEVGADVLAAFEAGCSASDDAGLAEVRAAFRAIDGRPGKYLADIYALARSVLRRDGVHSIAGGDLCTVSDGQQFYSYRRDHVTGRQASLIWIK